MKDGINGEPDSGSVTLYHGTSQFYDGPPTKGGKDVLRTGHLSMTGNPEVAELFAGSGRDARIYSLQVPKEAFLDLRQESARFGKRGQWDQLAALVQDASKSGRYQAAALTDITMGTDEPEFRLIRPVPKEAWRVERAPESVQEYAVYDDILRRFRTGEQVSQSELDEARAILRQDAALDAEVAEVMEEVGNPAAKALKARVARDRELYQALAPDNTPVGLNGDDPFDLSGDDPFADDPDGPGLAPDNTPVAQDGKYAAIRDAVRQRGQQLAANIGPAAAAARPWLAERATQLREAAAIAGEEYQDGKPKPKPKPRPRPKPHPRVAELNDKYKRIMQLFRPAVPEAQARPRRSRNAGMKTRTARVPSVKVVTKR